MDYDNSKLRLPIHLSIEDPSGAVPSGTQGFPTAFICDRRLQKPRTEGAFVRPWSCTVWVSSASCFLGQGCIYDIPTVDYGLITGGYTRCVRALSGIFRLSEWKGRCDFTGRNAQSPPFVGRIGGDACRVGDLSRATRST